MRLTRNGMHMNIDPRGRNPFRHGVKEGEGVCYVNFKVRVLEFSTKMTSGVSFISTRHLAISLLTFTHIHYTQLHLFIYSLKHPYTMCPPADQPNGNGTSHEDMVPVDTTNAPHIPPPPAQTNGHSEPPPVKSHKGVYGRASDFLSNTSNWKVSLA